MLEELRRLDLDKGYVFGQSISDTTWIMTRSLYAQITIPCPLSDLTHESLGSTINIIICIVLNDEKPKRLKRGVPNGRPWNLQCLVKTWTFVRMIIIYTSVTKRRRTRRSKWTAVKLDGQFWTQLTGALSTKSQKKCGGNNWSATGFLPPSTCSTLRIKSEKKKKEKKIFLKTDKYVREANAEFKIISIGVPCRTLKALSSILPAAFHILLLLFYNGRFLRKKLTFWVFPQNDSNS